MAMIASLRQRPTRAPSSSSSTTAVKPSSATAATTAALFHHQEHSPLSETPSTNPATSKAQFFATKNDTPSFTKDQEENGKDNNNDDDGGSFLELDCHDILQNMQHTLDNSLQKTTETWRSTKATANEKIREVEHQVAETWDIATKAAIEGAKRLLRFEELPKE